MTLIPDWNLFGKESRPSLARPLTVMWVSSSVWPVINPNLTWTVCEFLSSVSRRTNWLRAITEFNTGYYINDNRNNILKFIVCSLYEYTLNYWRTRNCIVLWYACLVKLIKTGESTVTCYSWSWLTSREHLFSLFKTSWCLINSVESL